MKTDSTFQKIYQVHADMVFNLCLHYVQNKEDAEELTQDVFVKVHGKLSGFQGKSSIKTWVYRMTINRCLDHIKAKKRAKRFGFHVPLFDKGIAHSSITEFDHPGVKLEDKEALASLFDKINLLPPKQETALILKSIEGLSVVEISEVMELSSKAVESLLSRARANLKKEIEDSEGKRRE